MMPLNHNILLRRNSNFEVDRSSMSQNYGGRRALGEIDLSVASSSGDQRRTLREIDLNVSSSSGDQRRALIEIDLNVASSCADQRALGEIDLNMELVEEINDELLIGFDQGLGAPDDSDNDLDVGTALYVDENLRRNVVPSNDKRKAIFEALLAKANNGTLKPHVIREISESFLVPIRTVQRIWKQVKSCLHQGCLVDVSSGKCRSGRKKVEVDVSVIRDIPFSSRTTMADLCAHLHVSKGKLLEMKRDGTIKCVSNSIKPYLTEKNKKDRLKWCISMLDSSSIPNGPMFKGLFDFVFIDEKWFNITRKTERYYVLPDEDLPTRTCKNKNFIPKIMFFIAVARPRFDSDGNCTFDGKIGCFPFVKYEAAKRSSANRPAGTLEMKPIESVRKEVIRAFLIEKILPAIRAKWPHEDANKPIYIQQDNATPHI